MEYGHHEEKRCDDVERSHIEYSCTPDAESKEARAASGWEHCGVYLAHRVKTSGKANRCRVTTICQRMSVQHSDNEANIQWNGYLFTDIFFSLPALPPAAVKLWIVMCFVVWEMGDWHAGIFIFIQMYINISGVGHNLYTLTQKMNIWFGTLAEERWANIIYCMGHNLKWMGR